MVLRVFSFLIETALPVGVFFLQFLQWWYESDTDLQKTVLSLPVPPPPKEIEPARNTSKLPPHPAQCPICSKVHRNPTTLLVSGYVFCYSCIYKYTEKHNSCPVTNIPTSLDHLIKLYTDTS